MLISDSFIQSNNILCEFYHEIYILSKWINDGGLIIHNGIAKESILLFKQCYINKLGLKVNEHKQKPTERKIKIGKKRERAREWR